MESAIKFCDLLRDYCEQEGIDFDCVVADRSQKTLNPARVVIHNYGVCRYQSLPCIKHWVTSGNPFAHVYISEDYILLAQPLSRRAVHVNQFNVDSIGVELNDCAAGLISEQVFRRLRDVLKLIGRTFGNLELTSHRRLTNKNCPARYEVAEHSTVFDYVIKEVDR